MTKICDTCRLLKQDSVWVPLGDTSVRLYSTYCIAERDPETCAEAAEKEAAQD